MASTVTFVFDNQDQDKAQVKYKVTAGSETYSGSLTASGRGFPPDNLARLSLPVSGSSTYYQIQMATWDWRPTWAGSVADGTDITIVFAPTAQPRE